MSAYGNPKIVDEGLVFMYDANNKKSFKGRPTENLWDDILNTQSLRSHTKHYWNGRMWKVNSTYSHPGVEGPKGTYLGIVFKHTSGSLNSTWSGNSYGYMLRDIACTSGSTFTQSCWVYASEDCNVDAIPSVIEQESSGESTPTGYSNTYDLNNKGTWQIIARKAISDGQVRFIPVYPRKNGVTNGSFTGFFMWALPQVVEGSNVVRPIQPGKTRSATQGLLDRTGNSSINLSNVSFDSNSLMTFDGTDDYISVGNPAELQFIYTDPFSLEAWVKADALPSFHHIIGKTYANYRLAVSSSGYTFRLDANNLTTNSGTPAIGEWQHVVATWEPSTYTARVYVNGVLEQSVTDATVDWTNTTANFQIGNSPGESYYFNGMISVAKAYNKTITSAEALKNFNATKSRFGL